MSINLQGLIKKRKGYHFVNSIDLVKFFVKEIYPNECIVALLDCKAAFTSMPKLNILKRDDYSTYLMGLANDIVLIEFANILVAKDYVYSLPIDLKLPYIIFINGKIIETDKGKV
jgi:hypothetical protein